MIRRVRPQARLAAVLSSRDRVLASLLANDIGFRTLADVPWRRLPEMTAVVAENAWVALVVSVLAKLETEFALFAIIAQWLLVFYAVAVFTPRVFLRTAREITATRQFRFLVATGSTTIALTLSSFLINTPATIDVKTTVIAALVSLGNSAILFAVFFLTSSISGINLLLPSVSYC